MAIARISDSLSGDLPKLLLESAISSGKSGLDSKDFKDSYTMRDYTDKFLPVMSIISFSDVQLELDKYPTLSTEHKAKLLIAIRTGIDKSKALVKSVSSLSLQIAMENIVTNTTLSEVQKAIQIKQMYAKGYHLSDSSSIIPDSVIFIVQNYSALSSRINKYVNAELKSLGTQETLGNYLDLGHSSLRYGDSQDYAFNSPKLTSVLFDISTTSANSFLSKSVNLNVATEIYAKRTEQLQESVTVTKEFGQGFCNIFVQYGGSVVALENSIENQDRGRRLERAESKFGVNSVVLKKLVSRFKEIKDTAVKGQYNTSELGRVIRNLFKYSSSPSALDYIVHQVVNTLSGKPIETFRQTKTKSKTKKVKTTEKIKVHNPTSSGSKSKISLRGLSGQFYSLASLQALLDRHLQDVISANMGNGNDRQVLNYRTGRLAASAKVERLSASREGIITAFYSYMRNPYGTFSDGGRQQYPRSRDPKLLIGNSIKEIAATQVANRMRAVLV